MATVVRIPLSASNNGQQISVAKIATAGNAVHSAAGGSTIDYITLRACNLSSVSTTLTLEIGGTADQHLKKIEIPGQVGDVTVLDRYQLGSSFVLAAFAGRSSVINLSGWVDRVS